MDGTYHAVTAKQITFWTQRTPVMSTVLRYIQEGGLVSAEGELKLYLTIYKRLELTSHAGSIVWAWKSCRSSPWSRESTD